MKEKLVYSVGGIQIYNIYISINLPVTDAVV